VVSLPLRISVLQDNGGSHPLVMDALAEMSEAQMQMRLTHPPVRAQDRSQRRRGMRAGGSLEPKIYSPEILSARRRSASVTGVNLSINLADIV